MTARQNDFFEALVLQEYAGLYRYALNVLHQPDLCEDLVMDTFHEAILQIDAVYDHECPRNWLIKVLRNKIGNYLTITQRRAQHMTPMEPAQLEQLPCGAYAEAGGHAQVLLLSIEQILSPEDYRFFVMCSIEGRSYTQLAREFDQTVWNCRKRMQRIRKQLKKKFLNF